MRGLVLAFLAASVVACGSADRPAPGPGESPAPAQRVYTTGLVISEDDAVFENLDVSNPDGVCIRIEGDNVTIRHSVVHNCKSHGVQFLGTNGGVFEDSVIYDAALAIPPDSAESGWPSSLKVQSRDETASGLAQNITIRNNLIYHGYGECIGLRGSHVLVEGNTVRDCYSVGIYSNGDDTIVQRNFVQCTGDPAYDRGGYPMIGIGFAEESFPGWGAHGHDRQTVVNNIVVGCKYGVRYGSSTNEQGLSDTVIAYNTLYRTTNAPVSLTYYPSQRNVLITNNIARSLALDKRGTAVVGNVNKDFRAYAAPEDFRLDEPLPAEGSYRVAEDYGRNPRVAPFDAGAWEYASSSASASGPGLEAVVGIAQAATLSDAGIARRPTRRPQASDCRSAFDPCTRPPNARTSSRHHRDKLRPTARQLHRIVRRRRPLRAELCQVGPKPA